MKRTGLVEGSWSFRGVLELTMAYFGKLGALSRQMVATSML